MNWDERYLTDEQLVELARLAGEPFECLTCGTDVPDPGEDAERVVIFCGACR